MNHSSRGFTPYHFSRTKSDKGFTLVEMIVSVALFATVMLVCVGALLALVGANRKVHALQSVMNNLNVTLDGMARSIREGSSFDGHIGCTSGYDGSLPNDCAGGGTQFSFMPYPTPNDVTGCPWVYRLVKATNPDGTLDGHIERSIKCLGFVPITSSDIYIDSALFFVVGSTRGCDVPSPCTPKQPKVVVVIRGTAPVLNSNARTTFHVQVTAVQRLLDL